MFAIVQLSSRATHDSNVGNQDRENGRVKMSIFVPPSATKPDIDHRSSMCHEFVSVNLFIVE